MLVSTPFVRKEKIKMKVLVTGNMGYVGSVLVPYLASQGAYQLYGFDAGYFEKCLTGPNPDYFLVKQYRGDIQSFPDEILEGMDAVIHLAALSNDAMGVRFDDLTEKINYQASVKLAQMARAHGVPKFIFASSCSLYGAAGNLPKTEQDSINPLTAYARSKAAVEAELKQIACPDFQIMALRFATACGASPRLRLDLVLNDFVATALTEKKIKVLSDGSPIRPLIHVKDMARSLAWALNQKITSDVPTYLVLNIGSDHWNYQIKNLADSCVQWIPGTQVEINPAALPDKRSYRVDFSTFKKLAPNHQPIMNLEQTVLGLTQLCRKLDLTSRQSYIRLAMLEKILARAVAPNCRV